MRDHRRCAASLLAWTGIRAGSGLADRSSAYHRIDHDHVRGSSQRRLSVRYALSFGHWSITLCRNCTRPCCRKGGSPFSPALVHTILTRETYIGRHYYHVKDSRTGEKRPRKERIEVAVPAIIPEKTFGKVQAILKSRDPEMAPGRSHSSPVLRSGRGRRGKPGCNGTMTLMIGKGGQYR
ncbi:hypothetical protein FSZ31_07755 [Sphingorhabdus soli]|uniref:Recombinase domain-containing protein n=1 Tax=Flavisphingopyxis soli TaxID=2601267 RepID=A0A5C6U758_9SPHN|nr:recombinase family protein [Sphingorhabdus soli]TXC68853.1 hypothetical protein FSZ31_07755 [Sphingorhabdus soli]